MSIKKAIQDSEAMQQIQKKMQEMPEALRKRSEELLEQTFDRAEYFDRVYAVKSKKHITLDEAKWKFVDFAKKYESKFDPILRPDYYNLLVYYIMQDDKMYKCCRASDHVFTDSDKLDFEKGFYINGNVGSGKTLGLEAVRKLAKDVPNPIKGRLVLENEIVNHCFNDKAMFESYNVNDLIIDDLGSNTNEGARSIIKGLLEVRYSNFKKFGIKTHISTNLKMGKPGDGENKDLYLSHCLGDRVHDRIIEMCNIVTVKGKSLRA